MFNSKLSRRAFLKKSSLLMLSLPASANTLSSEKASAADKTPDKNKYVRGKITRNCCDMCRLSCGINVFTDNGKVLRVEGQEDCPYNSGSLCAKAHAGIYQLYDPDRLKYPLIKVGERGDARFRQATWEEAIGLIAEKLNATIKRFGVRGIASVNGSIGQGAFTSLMKLIGSGNMTNPSFSQCLGARDIAWYLTYGMALSGHEPIDADNTKCMMFIGRNALESLQVDETKRIMQGMENGAKLIAVDPRLSKTAKKAHLWLKIKPGTDLALTLGMIAHIVNNDLYNKRFVEKYCIGLPELKDAMKSYSILGAAKETDIPVELIEESVMGLVNASPKCFVHPGKRLSRYGNDTQYSRAVAILNALLGNWGSTGGFFMLNDFENAENIPIFDYSTLDEDTFIRADGAGTKYPLSPVNLGLTNRTFNAILRQEPYPIRSLIVSNSNVVLNGCNNNNIIFKTLSNLDFIVTCDIYMNETCLNSDVVLPESTFFERKDPIKIQSGKRPFLQYREPAIEPIYDTKSSWEIVGLIAKALGYKGKVKTVDEMNKIIAAKAGTSVNYLKDNGIFLGDCTNIYPMDDFSDFEFPTPSGKIELYSMTLQKLGFDPIPKYTRQIKAQQDNELRVVFGRESQHNQTQTQNNRWLLAAAKYDTSVWLPKSYADKIDVKTDDFVVIVNNFRKSAPVKAFVTDRIYDGVLYIPHGYGRTSKKMSNAFAAGGVADSDFCSNGVDPITGTAALNLAFAKVEKY